MFIFHISHLNDTFSTLTLCDQASGALVMTVQRDKVEDRPIGHPAFFFSPNVSIVVWTNYPKMPQIVLTISIFFFLLTALLCRALGRTCWGSIHLHFFFILTFNLSLSVKTRLLVSIAKVTLFLKGNEVRFWARTLALQKIPIAFWAQLPTLYSCRSGFLFRTWL